MGSQDVCIEAKETELQVSLSIKKPSMRYLDEFVKLKCAPDLLASGVFPNAKEITESLTCYNAARQHLRKEFPLNDKDIRCFVVGDGNTPRTGAIFAMRTAWRVISIDPRLKPDKEYNIDRLNVYAVRVEDLCGMPPIGEGKVVLVACHSHANWEQMLKPFSSVTKLAIIALPCCEPVGKDPDVEYADWGCWSPCRTVKIWRPKGGPTV